MTTAAAHEQFVKHFAQQQNRVYAYVRTLLPNRADAEDVFQQTVLVLWRKWNQFDQEGSFVNWACGIAHNEVRNFLRRHERRNQYLGDRAMDLVAESACEMHDALESRRIALAKCMDRLPTRDRGLLDRCYAEGTSIRAVAAEVGMTANVLYKTLRKVRRMLYECVNRALAQEGQP